MLCQSDRRESQRPRWFTPGSGPSVLLFPSILFVLGVLHPRLARGEEPSAPASKPRATSDRPGEEVAAPSLPAEIAEPRGPEEGSPAGTAGAPNKPAGAPTEVTLAAAAPGRARRVPSRSHDGQIGLAVLVGDGYRGIFPYDQGRVCGDATGGESTRVCTNRAPPFVDLRASFGISRAWDVLLDVRFGLRPDFTTKRQFFGMPGFRYWLAPQSRVKFFTTIQLAYDRSPQNQMGVKDEDLALRNANGLMVDLTRNLGIYAQLGETIGFLRWLSFMVDGGLGIEARFP